MPDTSPGEVIQDVISGKDAMEDVTPANSRGFEDGGRIDSLKEDAGGLGDLFDASAGEVRKGGWGEDGDLGAVMGLDGSLPP